MNLVTLGKTSVTRFYALLLHSFMQNLCVEIEAMLCFSKNDLMEAGAVSVLIIDRDNKPIDRVPNIVVSQVEHHRTMTMVRFFGRLFAYMPEMGRGFYTWLLVAMYWPAQRLSVHQYTPPHLRLIFLGRWELGLVLGSWMLGLKLGQPLMWLKRAIPAAGN